MPATTAQAGLTDRVRWRSAGRASRRSAPRARRERLGPRAAPNRPAPHRPRFAVADDPGADAGRRSGCWPAFARAATGAPRSPWARSWSWRRVSNRRPACALLLGSW